MAKFEVQIMSGCTVNPHKIPPSGKCVQNDTVTFNNQTSSTATLNFTNPPGDPFTTPPPLTVPGNGSQTYTVAGVSSQTTFSYSVSCSGGVAAGGLSGDGIIIVD